MSLLCVIPLLHKAVEVDSYLDWQDMSLDLISLARKAGCRISLGTDSHGASQLEFIEFGLAAALKGKIDLERILEFHESRGFGELGQQRPQYVKMCLRPKPWRDRRHSGSCEFIKAADIDFWMSDRFLLYLRQPRFGFRHRRATNRDNIMAEKFALITGASSGIGFSLAKELAGRGYDLAISSSGVRLQGASEKLRAAGVQVTEIQTDLATRAGVTQLWGQVTSLGRNVDVACINAGVGVGGLFADTDLDAELNMVYLNCAGTIQLAKYVVQHMKDRKGGRILFTASIAGEMVAPREAVYAATKAFDLSFAHSLRYELRDTGISVTALQPGPTDTDFFHRAGMDNTEVGSTGKSDSQPDDVARQGIEALLAGKDHVYAASTKTKVEGMLVNVTPGSVKAAMHDKMAKPKAS
jgi:uncharacterized protein